MPEVLEEALSELQQQDKEANQAAETAGQQLLEAFKDDLLAAGKAALLKRLSPIVSKWLRASRACVERGPAVDEEQAGLLQEPENSAKCLVQELWPALLATLKARARHSPAHVYRVTCHTYTRMLSLCHAQTHACSFVGERHHPLQRLASDRESKQVGAADCGAPR